MTFAIGGAALMPTPFEDGLENWSSGDGTAGAPTYDGAGNAAIVPADQDFGSCLELLKTAEPQYLRYTQPIAMVPGRYLRIVARVKAVGGALPRVRIAARPGRSGGAHVAGLVETGPEVALTEYGAITQVSAVLGTGARDGVDLAWGLVPDEALIGLDLVGPSGGAVRIDDLRVEDVTSHFLGDTLSYVDVRDYGAKGDGISDDRAALEAADSAANGRTVLVPAGTYRVNSTLTLDSPVRFVGTLSMPDEARLALIRSFELPSYIDAFGDEALGLRKAIQALFNYTDHDALDLRGRRVDLFEPLDIQAAVGNLDSLTVRRVIRNGQIYVRPSPAWDTEVVTSHGTYHPNSPTLLSGVQNVVNVPVGALVEGNGVGREVYVRGKDESAGTVTLSQPLYDAEGTQIYTFRRFKYAFDFSNMAHMDKFALEGIDFQCNSECSAILLPPSGINFQFNDCYFTQPKDRGITSHGTACQGLNVDRCQFLSSEQPLASQDRVSIALNVNANDSKIRNNRVVRFLHFAVLNGSGHIISGNHWFQGDNEPNGVRTAGLVLTQLNVNMIVDGNYVDNCPIEWTNEHDARPDFGSELSFGGLTVTDNIFVCTNVAPWFRWLIVKPYGPGHFLHGLNVGGNTFKAIGGAVDRIEQVDTSYADLDYGRFRNIRIEGNTYNGVSQLCASPVTLQFDQNTDTQVWVLNFGDFLPFGGRARNITEIVKELPITGASGTIWAQPFVRVEQGPNANQVKVEWPEPCQGRVHLTARVDNPN
ncbi:glycosyl hydrolase family 28-related protein [Tropicimonas sp. IMCC34011]|uniref:glycosyl hydrolase family 28-related protein n=1 Tax=Tropicimonas sp. IMCC34011 TaxID=2248759 RepID=UPI000E287932|nr:glycosyl hydrolase family 28-related protein [Tropicimonas sp. IMCC34011]